VPRPERRARSLKDEVRRLGEELAQRYPDLVVVAEHVEGLPAEVRPDLSWMNGRWHHAFTALPGKTPAETVEHYASAAARGLMVPTDRVTLVIAVDPDDAARHEALSAASSHMKERGLEPVLVPSEPTIRWRALEARIEHDVRSRH
jgi:hypothetical protein